jgi:hypothetical protein
MKYLKYFESYKNKTSEIIDIPISNDEDVGGVYGVIHFKKENLDNWLYNERVELNIDVNSIQFPVAILKNINVQPDYQNIGYGNEAMGTFLDATSEAKSIILIADLAADNKFDLVKWYEGYGFEIIGTSGGDPVMLLKNE